MVDSITAQWHGHNYQARIFWQNALNLLDPTSCVVEVTFEANGPKSFDDVVVRYDPAVARSGSERVPAEYHQVKWHVEYGGRFGYEDLTKPEFIGAVSFSLLQRLHEARKTAQRGSHFSFITTYRISDHDPLSELISANDRTLLVGRLFQGATDKSRMGKVRKLWREHLGLSDDNELRDIVGSLRIFEGHSSLEDVRGAINAKAKVVGLLTCETASDFRYDELARQLKVRGINVLTRDILLQICREEGLLVPAVAGVAPFRPFAIRSFLGPAADISGAPPDDTLLLTDEFRQRYLQDGREWQRDIRPAVEHFLREAVRKSPQIQLILDAHASIAFLAGQVLDLKSGVDVHLVQKGRVGSRTWRADDGTTGPSLIVQEETIGPGTEIAVAISVAQNVNAHVRAYSGANLTNLKKIVTFEPLGGPSQRGVAGGAHAAAWAEQISNEVRRQKAADPDALVHIFAACPNSLLFFLGQSHQGLAPCIVYEYDFDRKGNKSYQPSFIID